MRFALFFIPACVIAAIIPADLSGVRPGAVTVAATGESLTVRWPDEASRTWTAEFSLDSTRPLITSIGLEGRPIVRNASPQYWAATGKRRGRAGFDEFFDNPTNHPNGTRRFEGAFKPVSVKATSAGDRVELLFDGLQLGIFSGAIAYTFYPGSRLLYQEAVVSTQEPETAYLYDTGLRLTAPAEAVRPGRREVVSPITYYDTDGRLQTVMTSGPDRRPATVRYRAIAAKLDGGSVAVFPPPHTYIAPRDYTTNMGYVWFHGWAGRASPGAPGVLGVGIRHPTDDGAGEYYPWMNAPPGTVQRLGVFFFVSDGNAETTLDEALRFTHRDRFPALPGYKTITSHWHWGYTIQALHLEEHGQGEHWVPPFKQVLQDMGIDAAMISDFHGDGHPSDVTDLRLEELSAYDRMCRKLSDAKFLLIPAEEGSTYLGGHWSITFPKLVYWFMRKGSEGPLVRQHPKYGTVYHAGSAADVLEIVRRENGMLYQTHPRTKSSFGYPDSVRQTAYFLDPHYIGAGWKAMPADRSTLRQGVRAFKLLDDMNNWGLPKRLLAETDMFAIDQTSEIYAHMNANYVRMNELPDFDHYGQVLEAVSRGDYFISMGEVLLPKVEVSTATPTAITVKADIKWTFPLAFAEIVWGDGNNTFTHTIPLAHTRPFGNESFTWKAEAKDWKWARLAVWDVAGNGAFINPVRR
ncbi:MAG: hypothetical protein ABJF23_34510 [Bryobacteraceae bacterium]